MLHTNISNGFFCSYIKVPKVKYETTFGQKVNQPENIETMKLGNKPYQSLLEQ